ncbi:uncharacterized threonine-rich GPI-anchored glycoprotein PJ4664.02-like [Gigantopelta aegis]|uniref:uncharacterized threonine-rich GPI-anchored glycoprotein PJ4664.02-like n=1 Tax=Gigantopelta aegis TaxID=1735272 RepID=UPI001B88B446|nr:uncharacterized threonine-rich GPI-anchored glycoprotein PJ4664.02-like [Gigantopelta aegis]XP_041354016.1 uncharacterized threonine-rich GPI-anchored glycoprotein PJ4664.02-like [Gigantopelta aegis]
MAPKKTKKRPKQNLSHGSGSSSESDGSKGMKTHRRSERLGKLHTDTRSPVVDLAYDGDGETTEENVSENSDQVMRSAGSDAYDFEDDDVETSPQTLSLYQKVKTNSDHESKTTKKTDRKKNSSQENKSDAKMKSKVPKPDKSSHLTLNKCNNFSVACILKAKFDNKIVDASSEKLSTDSSVQSPPVLKTQNTSSAKMSLVTRSNKTALSKTKTQVTITTNKTPVTSINKKSPVSSINKNTLISNNQTSVVSITKKTPLLTINKRTPNTSANKKTPVSSINKKTPVSSINKKTPVSSINKKTPVVLINKNILISSFDKNTPVTSNNAKNIASSVRSNTSAKPKTFASSRITKRKAAVSNVFTSTNSSLELQRNDSGVFISPPPVKLAKLGMKDTSTPSNPGTDVVKDSCFGFTNLNLVGSPMLSPVQKMAVTPTSDYCSAVFSLSQISVHDDSSDLKRVHQHSVFSGDDLEPDIALNKVSSKTYKPAKQKRAKGRYSSSKVEAWAEKVNQEFDDLDNFELSIEG